MLKPIKSDRKLIPDLTRLIFVSIGARKCSMVPKQGMPSKGCREAGASRPVPCERMPLSVSSNIYIYIYTSVHPGHIHGPATRAGPDVRSGPGYNYIFLCCLCFL